MQELVGKKIKRIFIDADQQQFIKFEIDGGEEGDYIMYSAYGDCCSESYFSELIGVTSILGKEILFVEEMDLGAGEATRQGYDTLYAYRLKTEDTSCLVIFRNSSNGYYGGSCDLYTGELPPKVNFIEVKANFDAG